MALPERAETRLAEVEAALARLAEQYELAMSSFKFDEARALQQQIGALDAERGKLVATLPPAVPAREPRAVGVVPTLAQPRRFRRRSR